MTLVSALRMRDARDKLPLTGHPVNDYAKLVGTGCAPGRTKVMTSY